MAESSEQVTRVRIYNQFYDVRGNDCDYVRRLAEFVDRQMSEITEFTSTVDTAKVAILAALNIADQYLSLQKRLERSETAAADVSEDLIAKLEAIVRCEPT